MEKNKKNTFDLMAEKYANDRKTLLVARTQEMQSILPNHFTRFQGVTIPSGKENANE